LGHDYSRPDRSREGNATVGESHVQPVAPLTPEDIMYTPFERFQQKYNREAYLASRVQPDEGPECVNPGRPNLTGYAARQPGRGGEYRPPFREPGEPQVDEQFREARARYRNMCEQFLAAERQKPGGTVLAAYHKVYRESYHKYIEAQQKHGAFAKETTDAFQVYLWAKHDFDNQSWEVRH
jgi:hypothetical protein